MHIESASTLPSASPAAPSGPPHVAIIGAGVVGIVVAQALKKHSIPFTIFEREEQLHQNGTGWGLTIHWALPALESLLPQHLVDRLPEVSVNQDATYNGEGAFLYIELSSGKILWKVPPNRRIRVRRQWFRELLVDGLDINWNKRLQGLEDLERGSKSLQLKFEDGSTAVADVVLGCDGSKSVMRSYLNPQDCRNSALPIRLVGTSVKRHPDEVKDLLALDPLFMQGSDSTTDVFMYLAFLETPQNNRAGTDTYTIQIIMSWPYRPGFRGRSEPTDMPGSDVERVALMKEFAHSWAEPFRSLFMSIPDDNYVKPIQLEDWFGSWDNMDGRCTLLGDAAHSMTMFRGEGANHAIEDAAALLRELIPALKQQQQQQASLDTSKAETATVSIVEEKEAESHHTPYNIETNTASSPAAFDSGPPSPGSASASMSASASTAPSSAPHSPASSIEAGDDRESLPPISISGAIKAYEDDVFVRGKQAVLSSRQACYDGHVYERINDQSPLITMRRKVL